MTLFRNWASLILLLMPILSFSQNGSDPYVQHDLNPGKSVQEMEWDKVMEGVDYSEKRKSKNVKNEQDEAVPNEEDNGSFDWGWWDGLSTLIKFFCIILLIVIVGFLIYRLTLLEPNKSFRSDRSFEKRLQDAEEHLEESELEELLREATEKKEFKMAIRIYFLLVLQKLSESDLITYKKEKTNFLYLLEMKAKRGYENFRQLTYIFEYSWYGEVELNEDIFAKLQANYQKFIEQLQT